jgi:hypothetical protein
MSTPFIVIKAPDCVPRIPKIEHPGDIGCYPPGVALVIKNGPDGKTGKPENPETLIELRTV